MVAISNYKQNRRYISQKNEHRLFKIILQLSFFSTVFTKSIKEGQKSIIYYQKKALPLQRLTNANDIIYY